MAPRANWKGFLKLSLVSCSIALVQATSSKDRIRFNIINRETGNRIRYRQVDAETGDNVPEDDRVKGYKTADGSYVLLEAEKHVRLFQSEDTTEAFKAFVEKRKPVFK